MIAMTWWNRPGLKDYEGILCDGAVRSGKTVSMVVIAVFAVLALRGDIEPNNAMIIISMVVSFYFGTQHEKK